MKKIIFILICLITFFGIDHVSAICYKVVDNDNGAVSYLNSTPANGNYTITPVSDKECQTKHYNASILNDKVSCGRIGKFNRKIPEITSWVVSVIQVIVPVILVIVGSIDFVKAVTSQKEEEIKNGQQIFIKRAITAVIIFFVVVIVKLIISVVSSGQNESESIIKCIDCFISNDCS